jgi:hypothetical protein
MIERGSNDFYKFHVSDENAEKVTIVLHSHVGDADLKISRLREDPSNDSNSRSN